MIDPPTKAIIEVIGAAGYGVQVGMAKGYHVVEAVDSAAVRRSWSEVITCIEPSSSWLSRLGSSWKMAKGGRPEAYSQL